MSRAFLYCGLLLVLRLPSHARVLLPIHFAATANPSVAHPGEVVTVTVRAMVDPGWHVYSVVPTPNGPSATEMTIPDNWQPVGPTMEDAPIRKLDPNFGKIVRYHEGTAAFSRAFRVPASFHPMTNHPSLPEGMVMLHYQTCNARVCLPPTEANVVSKLTVIPGPLRSEYAQAGAGPVMTPIPAVSGTRDSGLGAFLLLALGGGLLAIVTPCVFPLIPITLTNFVKQAENSQTKLVRLSFGYALGIVALYVALGAVIAAALGGHANTIAANPWVNLVEFGLFVVFALSFFETIQIPVLANLGGWQQAARRHGGTAGLALLGVTFVLGSFTCTAPFVGTLLVSAAGGQWLRPLLGMLVFALAFASPFFVFALFPQWIGRIPRSGLWLARFKATLGFIEMAAALKFLSNADMVWQWKLLTQPVLLAAWAFICFCAALYLCGTLRFGLVAEVETADSHVPLSRKLAATTFALAGLFCFWGLTGRSTGPLRVYLPPPGYGSAIPATTDALPWLSNYQAALAMARTEGKPLLIDFTGYTCTNCRYNETQIFPHTPVQEQLAKFVRVQLYTDGGHDGPQNQTLQESKFADVALPLYGVLNPQTGTVVAHTEGVQSVDSFSRFLAKSSLARP